MCIPTDKIEITPADAMTFSNLITEKELEAARLRYTIKFDEDGIEEAKAQIETHVNDDAADRESKGDKSLSTIDKRKTEVEARMAIMPSVIDARKRVADNKEKLVYAQVQRDSYKRSFDTILAFAHTSMSLFDQLAASHQVTLGCPEIAREA